MTAIKEAARTFGLTETQLLDIHHKMLLSRALSVRQRVLQRMGRGPMTFSGEGHEAAQVGSAYALRPGVDWVFAYYRDVAVAVTIGMTARDILMGFFARADDISSGGRNMPSHFSNPKLRIVSGSAPIGTQLPHAAGAALASKLRLAVYSAMLKAVERARDGEGPTLIEAKTYRLVPHSSDDDDRRYRTREEVEEWSARDPISAFARQLKEIGALDDKREKELNDRVNQEVDEATEYAEKAATPEPASALRHVFVEERKS